jgi:hypothetical protein
MMVAGGSMPAAIICAMIWPSHPSAVGWADVDDAAALWLAIGCNTQSKSLGLAEAIGGPRFVSAARRERDIQAVDRTVRSSRLCKSVLLTKFTASSISACSASASAAA